MSNMPFALTIAGLMVAVALEFLRILKFLKLLAFMVRRCVPR
jgi:hypothetical protein